MSLRQDELRAGAALVRLLRLLEKLGIYGRWHKRIALQDIQNYVDRNLITQESDPNQTPED